ncbi:DNA polymerase III subunit epsilon [Candidatus Westeberhardia cardiocondylae]|uniref:DNA polymerase III subunit epsilon n=1 Tax=Candidatus Westeberhardia cardiocondylae TaxID=1594731 RepID=A0A0H5BWJ9_9ENTR|nr:DNA polymerase III subunit epsilon [Candidatus Westeberhardia cardiocondylae]MCR3756476.1 DNA polymerase III subunit epsilon [Candidatus Westeberhardia cardiocondylae]CEN32013.1 DNA polymerase III subunit epsilon [Candidatus Westeberhardia cardiocondylae]
MRQIILDTETTGMNKSGTHFDGHKIIEIGAVEIINRRITGRHFHTYLNPQRTVSEEAFGVHGISDSVLCDKPVFKDIVCKFLNFVSGSELVLHNAYFDIGFINYEIAMLNYNFQKIESLCKIIDTLKLARKMFPGKKNNLNALCDRYGINNNNRTLHGALLDAEILANVFLHMTSGQTSLHFFSEIDKKQENIQNIAKIKVKSKNCRKNLKIIDTNHEELFAHKNQLLLIKKRCGTCFWLDE